jgi:hypothetical protein
MTGIAAAIAISIMLTIILPRILPKCPSEIRYQIKYRKEPARTAGKATTTLAGIKKTNPPKISNNKKQRRVHYCQVLSLLQRL